MSLRPPRWRRAFRGALRVVAAAWVLSAMAAPTEPPGDSPPVEPPAAAPSPHFLAPMTLPNLADAIGYPLAVTADSVTGEVFVCDTRGNRVIIFDDEALFEYQIVGGDLFSAPTDIAVDPDGILVLLANHQRRRTILELDYDGMFLDEIQLGGGVATVLETGFRSLALSPSGRRLYVLDQANLTLWIADRDGTVRGSVDLAENFTERERQDMILGKVDVYGDRVLVAIPSRSIIRIFDLDGNPVGNTGIKGTAPCQIGFPMAAAMDVEGDLFVVDQQRMYIIRWDPELNACLGEYFGPGTIDGYMYYPLDVAVDPRGRVYISQGFEGRVQAFAGFPGAARGGSHPEATVVMNPELREYVPRVVDPQDALEETVRGWFRARSEMMLDEYRAHYSADFQPAAFQDRDAWAAGQRVDIEWTRLRLSNLQVTLIRSDLARTKFVESHRSDPEWQTLETTLLLRWEPSGWKILEERSVPLGSLSE